MFLIRDTESRLSMPPNPHLPGTPSPLMTAARPIIVVEITDAMPLTHGDQTYDPVGHWAILVLIDGYDTINDLYKGSALIGTPWAAVDLVTNAKFRCIGHLEGYDAAEARKFRTALAIINADPAVREHIQSLTGDDIFAALEAVGYVYADHKWTLQVTPRTAADCST
jgi:hypothetical protein